MATTLEQYYQMKQQLTAKIDNGTLNVDQLLGYQELLYRISVLEACMGFVKTAPVTTSIGMLGYHYQVVEAFFGNLVQERQIGMPADEHLRNQRGTALGNLQTVFKSFQKQFKSFQPDKAEAYRAAVTKMINTILPAWLQYRCTYVPF